jgi:hypothetical protein
MRKLHSIALVTTLGLSLSISPTTNAKAQQGFSGNVNSFHQKVTERSSITAAILNVKNRKFFLGNAVVITYPDSVKLKKKGCQNITISYKTYIMETRDYVEVQIVNDADNLLGYQLLYETPTEAEESGNPVWKKNGKGKIRICREDWVDSDGDLMLGASKGNFELRINTDTWEGVVDIKLK